MKHITKTYRATITRGVWVEIYFDIRDNQAVVDWSFDARPIVSQALPDRDFSTIRDQWVPKDEGIELAKQIKAILEASSATNEQKHKDFAALAFGMGFRDVVADQSEKHHESGNTHSTT